MSEKKIITIRGVSVPVYEKALRLARDLGITIGELVNEALKRYISTLETIMKTVESHIEELKRSGNVIVISNIGTLTVSRRDLENIDRQVVFKDIKELVFQDDITDELFRDKVYKIVRVDTIYIPKTLSSVLVASKCEFVNKILTK